ncbi:DUF3281 family protein, partial [Francisellaceae bacterium CB299]
MYSIVKMCKKIIFVPFLFVTAFLSSCSEQEKVEEFRIKERCIGNVCSLTLVDLSINRSRNVIGKITDHTLSSMNVNPNPPTSIKWSFDGDGGVSPDNETMERLGLDGCIDECKLDDANPTGWVFKDYGPQIVYVEGTVKDSDGNQRKFEITKNFTTVEHPIDIVDSIKGSAKGNIITASVDDSKIESVKRSLESVYNNVNFTWSISSDDEDAILAPDVEGKGILDAQFKGLNYSKAYKVTLKVTSTDKDGNEISASATSAEIMTGKVTDLIDGNNNSLQLLVDSIQGSAEGNIITASVDESNMAGLKSSLESVYKDVGFVWSISSDVEGAILAPDVKGKGQLDAQFKGLNYSKAYKVTLKVTANDNGKEISTSATSADIMTGKITDLIDGNNNSLQLLVNSIQGS